MARGRIACRHTSDSPERLLTRRDDPDYTSLRCEVPPTQGSSVPGCQASDSTRLDDDVDAAAPPCAKPSSPQPATTGLGDERAARRRGRRETSRSRDIWAAPDFSPWMPFETCLSRRRTILGRRRPRGQSPLSRLGVLWHPRTENTPKQLLVTSFAPSEEQTRRWSRLVLLCSRTSRSSRLAVLLRRLCDFCCLPVLPLVPCFLASTAPQTWHPRGEGRREANGLNRPGRAADFVRRSLNG